MTWETFYFDQIILMYQRIAFIKKWSEAILLEFLDVTYYKKKFMKILYFYFRDIFSISILILNEPSMKVCSRNGFHS